MRRRGQFRQQFGQRGLIQRRIVAVVAIGVISVAEHFDQIGLGQQPHLHRRRRRSAGCGLQGKPGHQSGGFAPTFRVDVANEINGLTGKVGQQRRSAFTRQGGNQIGLAGLAGAEHSGAHRALGGLIQTAGLGGQTPEFLGQADFLLPHPVGMLIQPAQKFGADLFQALAQGAELFVAGDSTGRWRTRRDGRRGS